MLHVSHVSHVSRPSLGTSGAGRRSLLSLACHLHGLELRSPACGRAEGGADRALADLKAELRVLMPRAGVHGALHVLTYLLTYLHLLTCPYLLAITHIFTCTYLLAITHIFICTYLLALTYM